MGLTSNSRTDNGMKKVLLHQLSDNRGVRKVTTDKRCPRMQSTEEGLPNAILVNPACTLKPRRLAVEENPPMPQHKSTTRERASGLHSDTGTKTDWESTARQMGCTHFTSSSTPATTGASGITPLIQTFMPLLSDDCTKCQLPLEL